MIAFAYTPASCTCSVWRIAGRHAGRDTVVLRYGLYPGIFRIHKALKGIPDNRSWIFLRLFRDPRTIITRRAVESKAVLLVDLCSQCTQARSMLEGPGGSGPGQWSGSMVNWRDRDTEHSIPAWRGAIISRESETE